MSPQMSLALQYAVIALAVAISAWVIFQKQAPNSARRLRIALALPLVNQKRSAWLRMLGKRIAPAPMLSADGCGTCSSCRTSDNQG